MSAKARITADFATQGDVASRLRISASRTAELRRQLTDLQILNADGSPLVIKFKLAANTSRSRNSKPSSGARVASSKKK